MTPALVLLNAYLALAAASTPAFRADQRPKTYAELDVAQRLALLRSPGWHEFLAAHAPAAASLPNAAAGPTVRFSIAPEEMRLDRPFYLRLPAP